MSIFIKSNGDINNISRKTLKSLTSVANNLNNDCLIYKNGVWSNQRLDVITALSLANIPEYATTGDALSNEETGTLYRITDDDRIRVLQDESFYTEEETPLITPTAIYGLRKINSSYTGYACRVQRLNDNATQDIGFSGNDFDSSSFSTFVGANSHKVTMLYDQMGDTNRTFLSYLSPTINLTGLAGKPSLYFNATCAFTCSTDSTLMHYLNTAVSAVYKPDSTTYGYLLCTNQATSQSRFMTASTSTSCGNIVTNTLSGLVTGQTAVASCTFFSRKNKKVALQRLNGDATNLVYSSLFGSYSDNDAGVVSIGKRYSGSVSGATPYLGYISEMIFFENAQPTSDEIVAYEQTQMTYYSLGTSNKGPCDEGYDLIYSTGGCSTVDYDAFLSKWAGLGTYSNIVLNMGTSQYSDSTSRSTLVSTYSWTIVDGGSV